MICGGMRFRAGPADGPERERDGKRIHRESHSHEYRFQNVHRVTPLTMDGKPAFKFKNRPIVRKKGKKNGTPSENSRSLPFFTQNAVNPSFPPQQMHIMAQNHTHFFLEKWEKNGPNPSFVGKKWGSFLELYISIRQRADHRDQSL